MQYIIELTPEEEKALSTDMTNIFEWINTAIHNKARKCMDKIIAENSDRQPGKISTVERAEIVMAAQVETAADKNSKIKDMSS